MRCRIHWNGQATEAIALPAILGYGTKERIQDRYRAPTAVDLSVGTALRTRNHIQRGGGGHKVRPIKGEG
jgi:hypothetical protein